MKLRVLSAGVVAGLLLSSPAFATDQYIGEVRLFASNFCPVGWIQANGQKLPISQYTALFSLVGTFYGGDGKTNFAVPNLQARAPVSSTATEPVGTVFGEVPRSARPVAGNLISMTWCIAYLGVFPARN
jgi:microcystin-dependent protein